MPNHRLRIEPFIVGQVIIFISGLFLLSIGKISSDSWNEILFAVGIALISTSLISFLNTWLFENDRNSLARKWGLKNIYEHRFEKDEKTNAYIIRKAAQKKVVKLDVITQNNLSGLRNKLRNELPNCLANGLEMRILIPTEHYSRANIEELLDWCKKLEKEQQDNIKICRYTGTPQDLYFRVDDMIFIGPYFEGKHIKTNDMTITYEFKKVSKGGKIYSDYFEEIWCDGDEIF